MDIEINGNIMTPKELRKMVKEIISETTNAIIATKTGTKTIPYKNSSELSALRSDPNISSIETTSGQRIKEMARTPKGYEILDPEFDTTDYRDKTISGISLADIIDYIKENPGVEKKQIQIHFGFVRPQIANAIVSSLEQSGIVAKSDSITRDEETGEITIADEPEVISRADAEDMFVGGRTGNFFSSNEPTDEPEIPEEPELPASDEPISNIPRMSDEDYNAWMEYMKYKERAARTKSALIQIKKQRRGSDDLSAKSSEEQRLIAKKEEYEQRLKTIIDSNEYVKKRVSKEGNVENEIVERFKKLANIIK